MVILTIDQGNTKAKLGVFRISESGSDKLLETYVFEGCPEIEKVAEIIDRHGVEAAIYCSVGHIDVRFIETLRGLLPKDLLTMTHGTPLPVAIDYDTPTTLGLDRVAAAVGATVVVPAQSAVVVDAGTALTADLLISGPGRRPRYCGGRISPGLSMRFRALSEFTARLPLVVAGGDTPIVGRTTEESIRSGVVRGLVAEIEGVYGDYNLEENTGETPAAMILTGGDAPLLMPLLEVMAIHEPHLNDIGLCEVLKYNLSLSI